MTEVESTRQRVDELLRRQRVGQERGVAAELDRLCRAVGKDLVLVGAAVTLMPGLGAHTVAAASSRVARRLEEAQFGVAEGPTTDAFDARRPVLIADLKRLGLPRWPGWAPLALEAGVRAVYAFPLSYGATKFGVLTHYADEATAKLDGRRLETALVFSESATEILMRSSGPDNGQQLEPDLELALDTHAHVYQAQGILMVDLGVSLPEALARMRAHAWATGQDLVTLAGEIVEGRTRLPRDDG